MSSESETIEAAGQTVSKLADPRVFPAVVALAAAAGFALMIYWNRQDQREERTAFLAALNNNTAAINEMTKAVQTHERDANARAEHRR